MHNSKSFVEHVQHVTQHFFCSIYILLNTIGFTWRLELAYAA